METEMLLRIGAISIAITLLFVNFDVLSSVKNFFKSLKTPVAPKTVAITTVTPSKQEVSFLDVVDSWHTLKNQCKALRLDLAIDKLDEVFPLLNVEESDV